MNRLSTTARRLALPQCTLLCCISIASACAQRGSSTETAENPGTDGDASTGDGDHQQVTGDGDDSSHAGDGDGTAGDGDHGPSGDGDTPSGDGDTQQSGDGDGMPVPFGGYIKAGSWGGYAWTATGGMASISPANYASVTDFPLCASGTLQPGYANVAMIGWNLKQSSVGVDPPVMTVTPQLAGINVAVKNPGGTELRLQIQGPVGDANDRWCAVIPGTGGFIPYGVFNTECWAGGNGTAYAGQPLVAALVLVSGQASSSVKFDFCVDSLMEANDDGPAPGQGCTLNGAGSGSYQITGDDSASVTRDGHNYRVQNNVWNGSSSEQALSVEGVSFQVTKQTQERDPNSGGPASYPSVFIGNNFGRSTSNSNLPKQVSALTHVPTAWRWASASGVYNAAYDVWFSTNPSGDSGAPSGGYLMVWFHDPAEAQPLGEPKGSAQVGARNWQVWIGTQNGKPVISYVPNGDTISEWSFDLNDFIQNAVTQFQVIQSAWYLSNMFAGFEIWKQGVGLQTNDFCAVVE